MIVSANTFFVKALRMTPKKKDKDRREGKDGHCCLGYGIDSIPCYFPPGLIEQNN